MLNSMISTIIIDMRFLTKAAIVAIQGDQKSRYIKILLKDGANDYIIAPGTSAKLYGCPGEHTIFIDCEIIDDNTLLCEITPAMAAQPGKTSYEIQLYGTNEERLSTIGLVIDVQPSLDVSGVTASDDFSALTRMISQFGGVHELAEQAESAKNSAELAATKAEDAKGVAENAAANAQKSAEQAAASAEESNTGASPIDPATVRDIFRCAMTYTNNKDSFTFTSSGSGTLFDADFSASSPKIDCSSLMMAWVMGIPYEWSKYAGKENIKHYGYGIDLPANPYATDRPNRYYTHEMAHYFHDRGWCFKPNENYSNIAPGDIIFISFASGDGQSEFHDSAYMKIDHCLLVLGYKDATHLTCLHTSALYTLNFFDVPILPSDYDSTSQSNYNKAIKLVARLPFRRSCGLTQTPVATDVTEKTTTSTTNGLLATLTLSAPLKKNTPYTLIAHVENAFPQETPSSNNYFGIRASYSSGASDATIFSWQRNVNPKDNLYRCYFVVEDDPITQLKLYVLSTSIAGHHYKFCGLFEGLVAPTPNSDGTFN